MFQPIVSLAAVLPGFNSRRTRLWAALVGGVVGGLALRSLLPEWRVLPGVPGDAVPAMMLAVFLAALVCEYMDSSLGMGYGTTLTPLLLLAGFEPLAIVPAILVSESLSGAAAGLMHQRDGNVDFLGDARARRTALRLAAMSAVGTLAAVWLAVSISKFWLGLVITAIILSMALLILASRRRQIRYRPHGIVALGAVAAFNKGLSGGGYGPLVTSGQVISGLPAKHAVAITSVAESLTCAIGVLGYLAAGKHFDPTLTVPLALGALLSVPMATVTVRRMNEASMRGLVGIATLVLGLVALGKLLAG